MVVLKPSKHFSDFFTGDDAMKLNAVFGEMTFVHHQTKAFEKLQSLKQITHMTKKDSYPHPTIFHTLFAAEATPKAGELWTDKKVHGVMEGYVSKLLVSAVDKEEIFKKVVPSKTFNVRDILGMKHPIDVATLEPIKDEATEPGFDFKNCRNAVPIPPFMLLKLLESEEITAPGLAKVAIEALIDSAQESNELEELMKAEQNQTSTMTSTDRKNANVKWQKFGEAHGLGVVLFLLNFVDTNSMKFEPLGDNTPAMLTAMSKVYQFISAPFEYTGEEHSILTEKKKVIEVEDDISDGNPTSDLHPRPSPNQSTTYPVLKPLKLTPVITKWSGAITYRKSQK